MTSQPPEHHQHVSIKEEIHHLDEVADKGESGETPFIMIGRVWLFVVPIALLMLGIAFAAYYLT
jgi:hypothetical protein